MSTLPRDEPPPASGDPFRFEESPAGEHPRERPRLVRRGMGLVIGVLARSALLLASRNQLPAAPVMVVVILAIGAVLWRLGDRGGRYRDRPVAAPVEAIALIAAVLGSIVVFWVVFGWLQ